MKHCNFSTTTSTIIISLTIIGITTSIMIIIATVL